MAEITLVKMRESENGDQLCVWLDGGEEPIYAPWTDKSRKLLEKWASDIIDDDMFVEMLACGFSDGKGSDEEFVEETAKKVNTKLSRISRHITTDGIHVYFDGEDFETIQLDPELEKHLIKMLVERDTPEGEADFQSWAAFAENLYANVTPYIREQLVSWMHSQDWLSFTEDGCLIGYRGAQKNRSTGIAESVHCGPAIVNDEIVNGHVPNPDGAIVEMPRNKVVDDRTRGCESGLHVGTFSYAHSWAPHGGVVMRVKVDPRDVVSVPTDCSASKIRCCRFEVLDHVDKDDPGFEEKRIEWGAEWTHSRPYSPAPYAPAAYEDYDERADIGDDVRQAFEDMLESKDHLTDSSWILLFGRPAYRRYCVELSGDGLLPEELPTYEDWATDKFEDYADSITENGIESLSPDKAQAWNLLFGDTADEDGPEDYGCDYGRDDEDETEADEVVDNVAAGLGTSPAPARYGNIRTPHSAPGTDLGNRPNAIYRFD